MTSLRVQNFGRSVFVHDAETDVTLYAAKFPTKRAARKLADQVCQEIAAGMDEKNLCIAADIEKRRQAMRYLPPAWR